MENTLPTIGFSEFADEDSLRTVLMRLNGFAFVAHLTDGTTAEGEITAVGESLVLRDTDTPDANDAKSFVIPLEMIERLEYC